MKILIVSGFLGAGKTTFIKALAKHTGKEFAILENEYGAAGIDKDRLETELASGTVNIWEMTEGCICCSAKGDFALSVLSIANAVDPEYLVIEPTGVGTGVICRSTRSCTRIRLQKLVRSWYPKPSRHLQKKNSRSSLLYAPLIQLPRSSRIIILIFLRMNGSIY